MGSLLREVSENTKAGGFIPAFEHILQKTKFVTDAAPQIYATPALHTVWLLHFCIVNTLLL